MKILVLVIFLFSYNSIVGQPISTPPISIKEIYFEEKNLHFNRVNNLWYKSVSKREKAFFDKKNGYFSPLSLPLNTYGKFINNRDTMQIKLIFKKYFPVAPIILKLHFKKGIFLIDMDECVKEKGFIIKNFPCDCMAYRRDEEEISSK